MTALRKSAALVIVAALISLSVPANATPWHVMGPRAMGMGGSQVALAQGPAASYWNPAGLGQLYNTSGLEILVGARGEFTGSVLEGANNMHQLKKECDATTCTQSDINEALNLFDQNGNGAMVDSGASLSFKYKRVVLFVNSLGYVGVTPEIERVNIDFVNANPNPFINNTSKLIVRGGSFTELGLGYAHEIMETGIVIGANAKGIIGKVGYREINVATEDPGAGSFNKFKDNAKTSFQPGLDVGILWDMRETLPVLPMRPRFGVVARNINSPKFKQPDAAIAAGDPAHYKIDSQFRAGFALSPFKFWHIAADLDLTENLTPIDGRKSRMAGIGTEINVFNRTWLNIPLRAGIQKNISKDSDSGVAYTGGFGLNFLHVMVDLGAMVSSKSTTIQSETETTKIPNNVAASARVAILFGGKDKGARKD